MSEKPTPTFDELARAREDHQLGRNKVKRTSDMDAALTLLRDDDRGEDAELRDYIDDESVDGYEDRPRFKSERQAADALRQRAAEAAEDEQAAEQERATQAEQDRARAVLQAGVPDQQTQQAAQQLEERADTYRKALAEYQQAASDKPSWFTNDQQRQAIESVLQQEAADLETEQQRIAGHLQTRQVKSKLSQLPEELQRDTETRRQFKSWLRDKGVTDETIERETNADQIGIAFRKFKAEQRDRQSKDKKRRITSEARRLRWSQPGNTPTTSDEAKQQLRKSGNIKDALGVLTMKRMERTL